MSSSLVGQAGPLKTGGSVRPVSTRSKMALPLLNGSGCGKARGAGPHPKGGMFYHSTWNGYHRYQQVLVKAGKNILRLGEKEAAIQAMRASPEANLCFWVAALCVCGTEKVPALMGEFAAKADSTGIELTQAISIIEAVGMTVDLVYFDVVGAPLVLQYGKSGRRHAPVLALVPFNDAERGVPHWLGAAAVKPGSTVCLSADEVAVMTHCAEGKTMEQAEALVRQSKLPPPPETGTPSPPPSSTPDPPRPDGQSSPSAPAGEGPVPPGKGEIPDPMVIDEEVIMMDDPHGCAVPAPPPTSSSPPPPPAQH